MKDKLVKNHHKGIYYRTRKIMLSVIAVFSLGTIISIPTYIALNNTQVEVNKNTQVNAKEITKENKLTIQENLLTFNDGSIEMR